MSLFKPDEGYLARLPKRADGYPVPDIKTWNEYVDIISDRIRKNFESSNMSVPVLRGSVEDLKNVHCSYCGTDLIRHAFGIRDMVFVCGVIYCPSEEEKHPKEYWIEVWPKEITDLDKIWSMSDKDRIRNSFKLSDPRIKKCFSDAGFLAHRGIEANKKAIDPDYIPKKWPEPTYVHE